MAQPGYVYILVNPSANEFLKIGKTERDPEARAKELSSATGVPTPFYVAFQSYFQDCTRAEEFVHARLAQYRVANNREFFRVQLRQAIDTVLEAERIFESFEVQVTNVPNTGGEDDPLLDELNLTSDEPWRVYYDEARAYRYGQGDTLQDYEEALRLYKQATKLGCKFVYRDIGEMYRRGEGCIADPKTALEYFKEGARNGDERCWAEMAYIFHVEKHNQNADKCWDKYFSSRHFQENITYDDWDRSRYCVNYLMLMSTDERNIKHRDKIARVKNEVMERCKGLMDPADDEFNSYLRSLMAQIESW